MGHFYLDDPPRAFYEIEYKDKKRAGETRSVTVKDAREQGAYPSPNEAMTVLDKPGLMYWKQQQLAEAVKDTLIDLGGGWDEFAWAASYRLFKERTAEFAEKGTEIHDMLEHAVLDLLAGRTPQKDPIVDACLGWLREETISISAAEEIFVSPKHGIGGKIDLVGENVIVDWKTIDTKDKKFRAYKKDKTPLLAAYAMGRFDTLDVDCWNVFVSRDEPGKIIPKLYTPAEIEFGWKKFQLCYELWVLDKGYDPREKHE